MNKYNINEEFYYLDIYSNTGYRTINDIKIEAAHVAAIFNREEEGESKIIYAAKNGNILFEQSAMFDTKQMAISRIVKYLEEEI